MELSPEQVILVGLIATVISQVVKFLAAWLGINIGRFWITIVAFVISLGLGWLWSGSQLPICSDPLECALEYLNLAASVLGWATLIYNLLLDKIVFQKLGFVKERFLKA